MDRCFAFTAVYMQPNVLIFVLYLHEKNMFWYSLEAPNRVISNEYQQHRSSSSWRNKKNNFQIHFVPLLFRVMLYEMVGSQKIIRTEVLYVSAI